MIDATVHELAFAHYGCNAVNNLNGFSRNPTCNYDVSFSPTCDDRSVYPPHLIHTYTRTGGAGASDSTSPGGAESGVDLVDLMIIVSPYPLVPQEYRTSGKDGILIWLALDDLFGPVETSRTDIPYSSSLYRLDTLMS